MFVVDDDENASGSPWTPDAVWRGSFIFFVLNLWATVSVMKDRHSFVHVGARRSLSKARATKATVHFILYTSQLGTIRKNSGTRLDVNTTSKTKSDNGRTAGRGIVQSA